ncbi:MAG TPA: hypothetical protein ENK31_07505 [Nannocystis exedens]|nr:hypothetical protein [Nannocystis exedens]
MRKILKIIGALIGLVIAVAAVFVLLNWSTLSSFPAMPSSYEAKELCSCLFVEGRSQEQCEAFIRQDVVGIDGRDFDVEGKRVTVRALWSENSAHYVSARYGCVLD